MNPWTAILIGWAAMALIMAGLWWLQLRRGNAGIVDIAWAFGVGVLAVAFALAADGLPLRRAIIGAMAALWGARLGGYLWKRIASTPEDGRYTSLRETWGPAAQLKLFAFYQVQASWSVLFAAPALIAARNTTAGPNLLDLSAVGLWLVAVLGESIADRQLARFRSDPANRGKVCRRGLWAWSRHPNYFFEWLHWWCYALLAIGAPMGWLALGGPLVMLLFLFKVTGIPPTEAQALATRGEAYREYQRTTSAFFPWPPKRGEDPQ